MKKFFFFAALCCAMIVNAAEKALPDSTIWESAVDGSKEKTVYTYDANGNQTSVSKYNMLNNSDAWIGNFKYEYTWYDSKNKTSEIYYSSWDALAQNWIPDQKHEWIYDAKGNCISANTWVWKNNAWENYAKYEGTYDDRGNTLSETNAMWDAVANTWVNYYKNEYTYDDKDHKLSETGYNWDSNNNVWIPDNQFKSEYRADGKTSDEYSYFWNQTTAAWENQFHEVNVYLPSSDILYGTVTKIWEGNDWKNYFTRLYTYAGEELIASEATAYWSSEAEDWINDGKEEYTYNEAGELLSHAKYIWFSDLDAWVGDAKLEYIKDEESGQYVSYILYVWKNNDWSSSQKLEATYDEEGNLLLETTYAWTTDLHMWVKTGETTYYYPAASEDIDQIFHTPNGKSQKLLRNGQIRILKGDKTFDVLGAEVR